MPVLHDVVLGHLGRHAHEGGHCGCRAGLSGHRGGGETFGGPAAEPHYPPSLELEPVHTELHLRLDIPKETLTARVATTVVGRGEGARRLELDAVDFLDVEVRDAGGKGLQSSYDGRKLAIVWDEPVAAGEKRTVEIAYRVERPATGLFFMHPTPEDPRKILYAATDHETERARYWLPCIDLPSVRTTLDFHITAAADLTILANGASAGEKKNADGTKTARWRLEQRCPSYLVCFAVGDFVRCDDGDFEGLPVAYFAGKDFSAADLKRAFGRTKEMLGWMSKKLGVRFPFPKYYQFALPAFGGAMENISLVSWSDHFVLTEARAGEGSWLTDQVNVHEMAHSYFGDLVVCRDFAHAWLKESWATYMETCWLEDKRGEDEQLYDLYCNAHAYFDEADDSYARPLVTRRFTSSWQMYDRHLYPGGACRLHTLRKEVGDAIFWRAVSDYLTTYREQTVETDDFRRMLEKHSGRSLQKLFDQWVHTAAYPKLKVGFSYDEEKSLGTFEIEQKQVDEAKGVPAFELGTDIGWVIGGKLVTHAIRLTEARHSFNFRMDKAPEQVRFDPYGKVLHKLELSPGEGKLKAQLTGAKDVVGRILAAQGLAETGKRANIRAVLEAWRKEPFWGVRREMIHALEKAGTEDALEALVDVIKGERDPLVMVRVFVSAAAFRDQRITDAVKARIEAGDLAPYALATAYYALGAQRENAPIPLLKAAAAKSEPCYGVEQSNALFALGMTRDADAATYLRAHVGYGKVPYRARRGAVLGLGAAASALDKRARRPFEEALVDLLRDPEPWTRAHAARALRSAGARHASDALEAYRRTVPLQEQVVIDEILRSLRASEEPKALSVERQLEELQGKYRKLHEKLQSLQDKMA
jgi:aminopeptidase N